MEQMEAIGTPSTFACPDCGGSLWQLSRGRPTRFLCHTGHSYTLRSLEHAQAQATDEALWAAIRAMQEKRLLTQKSVDSSEAEAEAEGDSDQAAQLRVQAQALEQQEGLLRTLVGMPAT